MRRRISIRGCVRPSVRPSVCPWVRMSVSIKEKRVPGASYVGYPTLLIFLEGCGYSFQMSSCVTNYIWGLVDPSAQSLVGLSRVLFRQNSMNTFLALYRALKKEKLKKKNHMRSWRTSPQNTPANSTNMPRCMEAVMAVAGGHTKYWCIIWNQYSQ